MRTAACCLALLLAAACASSSSPYAGQEARALKALSPDEVAAFLEGRGQGFARPAELNGYPGPMHVLELAGALALTPAQREATQRLMDRHKSEARELGRQLVANEETLERLFASKQASPQEVAAAVARSAELQGRIRASHLVTHLEQEKLLDAAQVRGYARLRGYDTAGGHGRHH